MPPDSPFAGRISIVAQRGGRPGGRPQTRGSAPRFVHAVKRAHFGLAPTPPQRTVTISVVSARLGALAWTMVTPVAFAGMTTDAGTAAMAGLSEVRVTVRFPGAGAERSSVGRRR